MRYRKTPGKDRDKYKLYDDFGELLCEIKPGDYDVTAQDIKNFHAVDDHEVYVQSKEMVLTPFEKDIYKKWRSRYIKINGITQEDDGYTYPRRQFISLDKIYDEENDENHSIKYEIHLAADTEEDECIIRLREIISSMPEKWQFIYHHAMLGGFTNVQTAKLLNISEGRVRALRRKIEEKIRFDEILKNFFD